MSPRSPGAPSRRRGATPRRRPSGVDWRRFDRWLDRLVTVAVITALLVGGAALIVSLVLRA
ncbi:hypothetical protein [Halomonas getboli]|uniref:hypothetical protein n=1 Tax=Halomonas getboli TaxID=2935862 RepID=UPI001FFEEC1F|nr:hypothetical protein [Halomonas getboli]MCK2183936.1 hypothetical protein [Halomonas getboli]